jgi:tetratricopeptide (TPR) repeat protein
MYHLVANLNEEQALEQWLEVEQLINTRDFKRAEITIAKLLRHDLSSHDRAVTLIYRAKLRLLTNRHTETIDDLQEVAQHKDLAQRPEYLETLADTYLQRFETAVVGFADKNDLMIAQASYQKIMRQSPNYENMGWIYYQVGRIALSLGNATEADKYFRQAFFKPSPVKALTALCFERLGYVAFYEQRDYTLALTCVEKALATYPSSESSMWIIQTHVLKSKILQFLDLKLALQSAKYALQLTQNTPTINKMITAEVLFTVVDLSSKSKGYEREVIEHAQHFIQISKTPMGVDVTWSRIHEMLGDAYLSTTKYEQAIQAYHAVLQYNPYHPWENAIRLRIAQCHYQTSHYTKAVEVIEKVLANKDVSEDYQAYELLGSTYYAMGKFRDAQQAFQMVLKLAPSGANLQHTKTFYELTLKHMA